MFKKNGPDPLPKFSPGGIVTVVVVVVGGVVMGGKVDSVEGTVIMVGGRVEVWVVAGWVTMGTVV